jgi:hypothetical protein
MKRKAQDQHPCAVAHCRYYGRLGGRATAMPMCSHQDIKPPCCGAMLPPDSRHERCKVMTKEETA